MSREVPLLMPKMSMTMETGEVLSWLKTEGDAVTAGDPIAEVQTDKVDMEIESPVTGTLIRIVAGPGMVLEVGAPMGFITSEAEDLMAGLFDPVPIDSGAVPDTPDGATGDADAPDRSHNGHPSPGPTPVSRRGPLPAVPQARRRAAQLRVLLEDATPTGPNGLITVADVEKLAGRPASAGLRRPPAQPQPSHGLPPLRHRLPQPSHGLPPLRHRLPPTRRSIPVSPTHSRRGGGPSEQRLRGR